MRRVMSFAVVLFAALSLLTPLVSHAQSDGPHYKPMVAALNEWRLSEGLWPLHPNATLDALAQAQADYLIALPALPDDMHAGRSGENPMQRAVLAPYNWPTYGRADQVAIGEIAYVGRNVDAAITWWKGSSLHSRTVTNAAYREIGVGMMKHEYGTLFIVVLGARPNVLPVEVDASAGVLYLSNESYTYAQRSDAWLYQADQVRLFDAEGSPLSVGWQVWQAELAVPEGAGDRLFVMFTDGSQQVLAEVDFQEDTVLLPGTLDQATALAADVAVPHQLAPSAATSTPVPSPTVSASTSAGASADSTPTPIRKPSATPEPASTSDLLLVYDSRSLAAVNVSGASLDVSGLVLKHANGELAFSAWNTQWLSGSLTALAANDCLQVYGWDQSDLPKPSQCRTVRGVITISPSRLFWTVTGFDVYQGSTRLTACAAGAGECAITLP
ncbi:MAG: hypothetical protein JW966_00790 [Anaerolineae bacterium]|nr:hypothetical protein [Anaerolineae bacterium]